MSIQSEIDHLYIGKIPSYNDKIDSTDINYQERLKNNLTITTFEPIGYNINLSSTGVGGMWGANGEKNEQKLIKQSIYKIGSELNTSFKLNDKAISTTSALNNWLNMQKQVLPGSALTNACKSFSIIATNDSTVNETISNDYTANKINDAPSMLGAISSSLAKGWDSAKGLAGLTAASTTSLDSTAMISFLKEKNNVTSGNQLYALLLSQAIGIQTALPKIWQRSDYNNTSSFTIKLISPSGREKDVRKHIIAPLTLLTLACSPITFDGVSYGYPPIWKIHAKGLLNINLAAITAMVITRGGQDTLFNNKNQPTNIDVRITVEPLVNGFATALMDSVTYEPDANGHVSMLVANPKAITESLISNKRTKSFELKPLILT